MIHLKITQIISVGALALMLSTPVSFAQDTTPVGVNQVRIEPLKQTVPVIGRLIAAQAGVIASRTSGPVGEMKVQVGDRINKDDIIAILVDDTLHWKVELAKAETSQAKSAIARAKASLDLRSQELERLEQLKKSAAFSQARLEDKKLEVASAGSAMAEAQAALIRSHASLKLAQINLYNAKIRAPFGGVVSKRHTDVGAYVNVGSPVVDMIDDQNLEIEASVPSKRIEGLNPGTVITFHLETENSTDQTALPATVRAVVPNEDPLTRTRTVRFNTNFSVARRNLATNQSVILALPAGEATEVVTVHKDAVINRKGKNIVFIIEDGTANVRPVKLGQGVGVRFVVMDGLKAGDTVVVRGNERLRPGQKVSH